MRKLTIIIALITIIILIGSDNYNVFSQNIQHKLLYYKGKPTTVGIIEYIRNNQEDLIKEYREFIGDSLIDSLYDVYIDVDDISTEYNYKLELGYFQEPNTIVVTSEEKYLDYDLKYFPKYKRKDFRETNAFVKAVVIHELSHYYFYLVREILKKDIAVEYRSHSHHTSGSEFIEEGFCEYISYRMGEFIADIKDYVPLDTLNYNTYEFKYRYARLYVTVVLDKYGIQEGLRVLLRNPAPKNAELLKAELYIKRLK